MRRLPGSVFFVVGGLGCASCTPHDTPVGLMREPGAPACGGTAEDPWEWAGSLRSSDRRFTIGSTCDGSTVIAGDFWGDATVGAGGAAPQVTARGPSDLFVARVGAPGDVAWVQQLGGPGARPRLGALAVDDLAITLAGSLTGTVDVTPSLPLSAQGVEDGLVVRYDGSGQVRWVRALGSEGATVRLAGAVHDASGNVIVSGLLQGSFPAPDGQVVASGGSDVLLASLTDDGEIGWIRRWGGDGADAGGAVAVRGDGAIFVAGSFEQEATFGAREPAETRLVSDDGSDAFVALVAPGGELVWVVPIAGPGTATVRGVAALADGGVVIAVVGDDATRFGAGRDSVPAAAGQQIFLAELDAPGFARAITPIGGPGTEELQAFSATAGGVGALVGTTAKAFDLPLADGTTSPVEPGAFLVWLRGGRPVRQWRPHDDAASTTGIALVPDGAVSVGMTRPNAQVFPRPGAPLLASTQGLLVVHYAEDAGSALTAP